MRNREPRLSSAGDTGETQLEISKQKRFNKTTRRHSGDRDRCQGEGG